MWDVLERAPIVRAGMDGKAVGIDVGAALRLAELAGYDVAVVSHLLPIAQIGLRAGIRAREES